MWMRTTIAFLVAPAIGACAASLVMATLLPIYLGFFLSTLMVAYSVTLVVGVPWFLIWPWRPTSILGYAVAGGFVACLAAVLIVLFLPPLLPLLCVLTGVVAGGAFGLIMLPTSNQRLERPGTPRSDAP
jgi:hypothetical protein